MHFSTGQIVFAILFFLAFVAIMVGAYRKDMKGLKMHYSGVVYIFLGIVAFLLIYRYLSKFLH